MAAVDRLKTLLQEDIRQLDELALLLKTEKQKLSESDIGSLDATTQEKNTLLQSIRERARQKIHLLVDMGYRPNDGNPSRFIASSGLSDLSELWKAADTRLKECHALNSVNSRVVGHLQKRLARLSDIFRGTSGHQKLYGSTGQQTSVSQRSILASA